MLTQDQIQRALEALSDELGKGGVKAELCLYGGAAFCLAYNARPATRDVDAVFEPSARVRDAARKVAFLLALDEDWLNDAVKGFVVPHPKRVLLDLPALKVYVAEADYLLAMKALASRVDATDKDDVLFLIRKLDLKTPAQVFEILGRYYPNEQIKPATQYFIEELFQR